MVTSIIGGVFAALAADALSAGALPVAAAAGVGVVVTMAGITAFGWHQARRWRAAEDSIPTLFPSDPGPLVTPHPRRQTGPSPHDHPQGSRVKPDRRAHSQRRLARRTRRQHQNASRWHHHRQQSAIRGTSRRSAARR
jgi:hypothetical protein